MMHSINNLSIKWKLRLIILALGLFLCFFSGMAIIWNQHNLLKQTLLKDLSSLSEITAAQCTAPLTFNDQEAADEAITALSSKPSIEITALYNSQNALFSHYLKTDSDTKIPARPDEIDEGFKGRHLTVKYPVILEGERLGTLVIQADLGELYQISFTSAATVVVFMIIALLIAAIISIKLEGPIVRPLMDMADKAHQISEEKRYSLRAEKSSEDEVGRLVDAFNHMLEQIETQTFELQNHKEQLENIVERRTRDLQITNEKLGNELDERKRAERALHESEKKFRAIFDEASDGILIADVNTRKLYLANAMICRMLGYDRNELEGMGIMDIHPEKDIPYVVSQFERQALNEQKVALDIPVKKKNGDIFFADVTSSPITIDGNDCLIGIFRDITMRKENEQLLTVAKKKAEEATQLKNKFLSLISHDLRSPFQGILFGLDIIQEKDNRKVDDEKKKEMVEIIRETVKGSITMLNRLLDVSKIQSGKMTPSKKCTNLGNLVSKSIENIKLTANQKGINITSELQKDIYVFADPILLGEVLQNLLSNAVKFSDNGGRITIYSPDDGSSILAIRDTGRGIDRDYLPNIFRYDVKTSTRGTKGEEGSGLGLPLCMDIINAHGGTLSVESEPGRGSTFFINLPHIDRFIVVADDQEIWRSMLREQVAEVTGLDVIEAENGREVLEIIKDSRPLLILTDIDMPEIDGLELLDMIKNSARWKDIPVIVSSALQFQVLSGTKSVDIRAKTLSLGASAFLQKPADRQKLAQAIRECLNDPENGS